MLTLYSSGPEAPKKWESIGPRIHEFVLHIYPRALHKGFRDCATDTRNMLYPIICNYSIRMEVLVYYIALWAPIDRE